MRAIKDNLVKFEAHVDGLEQVVAELSILLNLNEIRKNPVIIKNIIKVDQSITMKAVTISTIFKLFDYQQFSNLIEADSIRWLRETAKLSLEDSSKLNEPQKCSMIYCVNTLLEATNQSADIKSQEGLIKIAVFLAE